ncbi:MAG: Hsp20/alpha crystallin family protein [Calditrichaeota bacterium]|nr:MAG: Hsp20/alpha crystallin family protein [Calditrichota bacterium]
MYLSRWNPARDLISISDEMNRLVDTVFGDRARETSLFKGSWSPAVDISEDDDNFYLNFELPGMTKEDVKVRYEEGLLTVTGEKRAQKEDKDINYHRIERSYGRFERSFRVPSRIVSEKIDANFNNGVLTITLPKAEEVKPKEIEVKIK